jgi:hypothetical protein
LLDDRTSKEPAVSPLTRIFIIALVVLSTMLAAATVVFVSKTDVTKEALSASEDRAKGAEAAAASASADAIAARERSHALENTLRAEATGYVTKIQSLSGQLSKANADLVQSQSLNTQLGANIAQLGDGLKVAQETIGKDAEIIRGEREKSSALAQRLTESDGALAEKTRLSETVQKELDYTKEQLAQTNKSVSQLNDFLKSKGYDNTQVATFTATPQQLSGVVREKRQENGVTMLTISLGANDGVQVGNEFNVVDQAHQQFLGILKITQTDQTEAYGRLEGEADKVAQVKQGNEVRSSRGS